MKTGHTYVRKLTEEQKQQCVHRYNAGESLRTIAASHSMDPTSIHSILKRRGVVLRGHRQANRTKTLNESVFEVESEERNYWIGFIMADGSISVRPYSTYLSVTQAGDEGRKHLERLRYFLGSNHRIGFLKGAGYANSQGCSVLTVASLPITESLAKFGVTPNKGFTAKALQLENCRHFWRGLIDGNGFVFIDGNGRPHIGLTGSKPICAQLANFSRRFCANANPCPNGTIWATRFTTGPAVRITKHLYSDCSIALPRKLAIARQIMEEFS